MKVAIYGPNLPTTGIQEHVHKPGCADTRKAFYRGHEPWVIDVETVNDVTFAIFDPSDFDYDETDPNEVAYYASEIQVFPCVRFD